MDPTTYFAEGGPFMYAIGAFNLIGFFVLILALALAIFARLKGKATGVARFFAIAALVGCFIPLCAGVGDKVYRNMQVQDDAESTASATSIPLQFGGFSTMCCLLPAIVIMMVLPRRRRGWEAALDETVH